jgi:hypothetical protein
MTEKTDDDELIEAIWRADISDYIPAEVLEKCIDRDVPELMR